jgi:hypothetical protein
MIKMFKLINRILARFKSKKVIVQEPPQENGCFLDNLIRHPDFLRKYPNFLDRVLNAKKGSSLYVGDITYLKINGNTYFKDNNTQKYFCDYDMNNPSKEVLEFMIEETTFTEEQLEEKWCNRTVQEVSEVHRRRDLDAL